MSQFQEKVFATCAKEALFDGFGHMPCVLAGAYLTISNCCGIIGADIVATGISAFPFSFCFCLYLYTIGLVFVLIFNRLFFKHDVPDQWCLL